ETNPKCDLRNRLNRSHHVSMTRHEGHDALPNRRRLSRSDVIIDEAGISSSGVQALPLVLEEDPHKHRAEREANQCEGDPRGVSVVHRASPLTIVVQALALLGRSALAASRCSSLIVSPRVNGQYSSGWSSRPRSIRRPGHPPAQVTANSQPRQNSGSIRV